MKDLFARAALSCTLALLAGAPALAQAPPLDKDDDEKQAEKDLDEAEKRQNQGPGQQALPDENPLEAILELMEAVEDRLIEADTGEFTQDEQRRIVEAMRFEDKTSAAIQELIERIENQPP